ncbi:citrate/2-methylcitrate synthase [Allobranchiibius sp. GilTou73]|uniref:citrate/2-methylcitrate synthase n=1 Tax=Allobranchiibius sp. GilTou73 TaxID=2904523 RepID=UPI001F39F1FD|nr:citrate/2-methylcitrate synthase [Allobranchiibius sp. GilTou73]UIJ33567.1 citrate synthase/methylcitrate synthase [Allobranchiibius sp. GilTou73]
MTQTADPAPLIAPPGLAGVVVADTALGDVRGAEGFFHYRQYDATGLARDHSVEDVWHLLLRGDLPDPETARAWRGEIAEQLLATDRYGEQLTAVLRAAPTRAPLSSLRTAISAYGVLTGDEPLWDLDDAAREQAALRTAAAVPWLVAAAYAVGRGEQPRPARPELGYVGNYLWMVTGGTPDERAVRALGRYLCLTVDHGFNASTFTARVVASTGADLTACVVAAIGALSGPLHGGAPSRALDALDQIGTVENAAPWARAQLAAGQRVMGFGHAVYRGLDPRSELLRETATELGGDTAELAVRVEKEVVRVLDEAKPDRPLRANVEYYAGVVMQECGIPRELFTPTFACSRVIGWTAHILEQARGRKIFRPSSRYVGPPVQ